VIIKKLHPFPSIYPIEKEAPVNIENKEANSAPRGTGWLLWAWVALLVGFAVFAVLRFLQG
jgi:hypothetical protein